MSFTYRLLQVEERIAKACEEAGRSRSSVTLIAVTKIFDVSVMREAYNAGIRVFGENYIQEFAGKAPLLSDLADASFHFIGHLQSNKARLASELFQVIHTVDSAKLAKRLDEAGNPLNVMVEVKLSGEDSKAGVSPDELPALIDGIRQCRNLHLTGLMTMPPWTKEAELSRPFFHRLGALAVEHGLKHLSMGMSNDFEVAIAEGATHIRVGTALFGKRRKM